MYQWKDIAIGARSNVDHWYVYTKHFVSRYVKIWKHVVWGNQRQNKELSTFFSHDKNAGSERIFHVSEKKSPLACDFYLFDTPFNE